MASLTWQRLLNFSHEKRGWDEEALRRRLADIGISSATVTNWKRRTAVPPGRYQEIAQLFAATVDDVLGRSGAQKRAGAPWPFPFTVEDWERVDSAVRRGIVLQMEAVVKDAKESAPRGRRPPNNKSHG